MPFEISPRVSRDTESADRGWRADLRCRFARHGDRTVIAAREHRGPLLVQRAFYPEPTGVSHVYLVHPPGGIVGGDRLRFEATLDTKSQALITTPAATKLYRSTGAVAEQHTVLRVGDGAQLEWLPQETIIYSGAEAEISTRVELNDSAAFLGWEVVCLGRPASGERFSQGHLRQRFEIWRGDEPLWIERSEYVGDDEALTEPWGLHAQPVFATLVANVIPSEALIAAVRAGLSACTAPGRCVVTALDQLVVCRYVGPWAETARAHLIDAWRVLRPWVMGRAICMPRIWST